MTFGELQRRLIRFVNYRISNGDFTERGLARMLRISQPQLHNVLKGVRKLTPQFADHILQSFGITVLDLLETAELGLRAESHDGDGTERGAWLAASPAGAGMLAMPRDWESPRKPAARESTRPDFTAKQRA